MVIGLIINNGKKEAAECAAEVVRILKNDDVEFVTSVEFESAVMCDHYLDTTQAIVYSSDVVITIGGDGTIIDAGKYSAKAKKPLIGINLGRVGFVAGIERYELDLLKNILSGDYRIQKRMLIDCTVRSKDVNGEYLVLNELTLQRDLFSSLIEIEVDLNKETIITYRADGIIFSTATGSTAYSFSAGGPVIEPDMQCILLNPLCPHALSSRQVIFSRDSILNTRLKDSRTSKCYLTVDGKNIMQIDKDFDIEIKKSGLTLDLIILKEKNFYTLLNEKLKGGST